MRRNTIRVMFLGALADAGLSLEDLQRLRATRKHRKGATLVPMAMVDHCKEAFKNIAIAAAGGELRGQLHREFLRMMADAHEFLQPAKDEAGERVPVPAKFVYSSAPPEPPAPSPDPPVRPPAPGTLLDANGQEFVEA